MYSKITILVCILSTSLVAKAQQDSTSLSYFHTITNTTRLDLHIHTQQLPAITSNVLASISYTISNDTLYLDDIEKITDSSARVDIFVPHLSSLRQLNWSNTTIYDIHMPIITLQILKGHVTCFGKAHKLLAHLGPYARLDIDNLTLETPLPTIVKH